MDDSKFSFKDELSSAKYGTNLLGCSTNYTHVNLCSITITVSFQHRLLMSFHTQASADQCHMYCIDIPLCGQSGCYCVYTSL